MDDWLDSLCKWDISSGRGKERLGRSFKIQCVWTIELLSWFLLFVIEVLHPQPETRTFPTQGFIFFLKDLVTFYY